MIIESIEVCGFRGFPDKTRLECGRGFTVVSGRNGAGKSTLCDAVEFAVTGTIDVVEKAAHESLEDYIRWRGNGRPERQYVAVTFSADDGSQFTVTRSSESGVDRCGGNSGSAVQGFSAGGRSKAAHANHDY